MKEHRFTVEIEFIIMADSEKEAFDKAHVMKNILHSKIMELYGEKCPVKFIDKS